MKHFIKQNLSPNADALLREAEGLALLSQVLRDSGNDWLRVPDVFSVDEQELVLTAIDSRPAGRGHMHKLGEGLARLHRLRQPHYGFETANYIGLSPQPNHLADNWGEFFVETRLGFQVGRIRDRGTRDAFQAVLRHHKQRLVVFLNDHCDHPSLLHGDLWSGNVLYDDRGVWLIDPAVYYGDREADLAMTEMFGGFSADFYATYDRFYPRTDVYPLKRAIYNLYHYLNHYNLFGTGYLSGCRDCLETIEGLNH